MDQERHQPTVLVVDDTPENIDLLAGILSSDYKVRAATTGERALHIAQSKPPDMILVDIMMPGMDGYEVCRRLKQDITTSRIPVIFITTMSSAEDERRGLELGAVDYITKPFSPAIVAARVKTHLALYDQNRSLEEAVQVRTAELNDTRLEIIRRLGRAAEFKDNDTGLHVIRMSHYARIVAEKMGLGKEQVELIYQASPMHDIGKIGISDYILSKPGPLSGEEWVQMKLHPAIGAEIIGEHGSDLLTLARVIALTHHEKWDGSGYPRGLQGGDIPLAGRIVAVADVFDALTNDRPYKAAWSIDEAVATIREGSVLHFDPAVVEAFMQGLPQIIDISSTYYERQQPQL